MEEMLKPVVSAAQDGLIAIIAAAVAWVIAEIKARTAVSEAKLKVAAAASVQVIEARTQPAQPMPHDPNLRAELKKEMADSVAQLLLEGAPKKVLAKVGEAVQSAWNEDEQRKRNSLANSERPTLAETPSAKADLGS